MTNTIKVHSPIRQFGRIPKCNQCQMLCINGMNTHELGCPNQRAKWSVDRQEWVHYYACFECGCQVERGETCDCQVG